jgi:uncharacterized membrane protein YtjA (UPF0391 family)
MATVVSPIGVSSAEHGNPGEDRQQGDLADVGNLADTPDAKKVGLSAAHRRSRASDPASPLELRPTVSEQSGSCRVVGDVKSMSQPCCGFSSSIANTLKERAMGSLLNWAVIFLVVALVAAFLGFGGVAGTAMSGAQMLFWVAIILFVISAVAGFLRRA